MSQSLDGTVNGLFVACRDTIYAAAVDRRGGKALVIQGPPGVQQPPYIIAVGMTVRQPSIDRPTMSPARSREKRAEIDTTISCYAAGTETVQQAVWDDCNSFADQLEAFFKTSPNEKLSGGCRDSWVSAIDGPRLVVAVDPKSGNPTGRVAESTVTVTAVIRY